MHEIPKTTLGKEEARPFFLISKISIFGSSKMEFWHVIWATEKKTERLSNILVA